MFKSRKNLKAFEEITGEKTPDRKRDVVPFLEKWKKQNEWKKALTDGSVEIVPKEDGFSYPSSLESLAMPIKKMAEAIKSGNLHLVRDLIFAEKTFRDAFEGLTGYKLPPTKQGVVPLLEKMARQLGPNLGVDPDNPFYDSSGENESGVLNAVESSENALGRVKFGADESESVKMPGDARVFTEPHRKMYEAIKAGNLHLVRDLIFAEKAFRDAFESLTGYKLPSTKRGVVPLLEKMARQLGPNLGVDPDNPFYDSSGGNEPGVVGPYRKFNENTGMITDDSPEGRRNFNQWMNAHREAISGLKYGYIDLSNSETKGTPTNSSIQEVDVGVQFSEEELYKDEFDQLEQDGIVPYGPESVLMQDTVLLNKHIDGQHPLGRYVNCRSREGIEKRVSVFQYGPNDRRGLVRKAGERRLIQQQFSRLPYDDIKDKNVIQIHESPIHYLATDKPTLGIRNRETGRIAVSRNRLITESEERGENGYVKLSIEKTIDTIIHEYGHDKEDRIFGREDWTQAEKEVMGEAFKTHRNISEHLDPEMFNRYFTTGRSFEEFLAELYRLFYTKRYKLQTLQNFLDKNIDGNNIDLFDLSNRLFETR